MKTGNWIPVDKDIVKYLPKGGKPFSVAEAYLSFRVDVDNNREWTINGYAVLWGWGRTKVQRFTSDLLDTGKGAKHESSNGHAKDGQSICFKFKDLSDESSKGRATAKQESSTTNNTNTKKERTSVPFEEIIALYHQHCTSLPKVAKVTSSRKSAISARWKEYGKSLDFFSDLFRGVEESDFLTGRVKDFKADFDWLMNPQNMVKIVEGKYVNKTVTPAESPSWFTGGCM
jgi:hypothetical protein